MTLTEATDKVKHLAQLHKGKFNNQAKFSFDQGIIFLDDTTDPPAVTNKDGEAPCTISLSLENFDKMLSGDLNPMMAFMSGKMKVQGDKGVAMKLSSLF